MVLWLTNAGFPPSAPATSWEDGVSAFPAEEADLGAESGCKTRLAFRLFTEKNRYLIMIIESLVLESRGVYSIMACIDWHKDELALAQTLDTFYTGQFDDEPRARQTIWAQNFEMHEFHAALDATAKAILGRELMSSPPDESIGSSIAHPQTSHISFPKLEDD